MQKKKKFVKKKNSPLKRVQYLILQRKKNKMRKKQRSEFMKTVSILDYGAAVSDRLCTSAIQAAIDDCFLAGGGKVLIPCGVFLTGGIRLRSNVTLYLEAGAILKGSHDPKDYEAFLKDAIEPLPKEEIGEDRHPYTYAASTWNNGLIRAVDAENIAIIGEKGSYLDGSNVYDDRCEDGYRGPHGFSAWRCKNIRLEGYTFLHAGNWAHAIFYSQDIVAKNVSAYGGHDGIDIRSCDRVLIESCILHTGDDAVAGYDNHDVVVRGCDLQSSCNVFRLGGNNILIENCTSSSPCDFGFRYHLTEEQKKNSALSDEKCRHKAINAFLYFCDFRIQIRREPGNVTVRNCNFGGVSRLFRMEFGMHKWCCNKALRSIVFENCSFTELENPSALFGDKDAPLSFTMKNCRLAKMADKEDFPLMDCKNFERIHLDSLTLENFGEKKILSDENGEILIKETEGIKIIRNS